MKFFLPRQSFYFGLLSYLFFVFFIVWAILYVKERILISDPAYYFFNIVNNADFFIPHTRHTAVITQLPLVLATRLHLPLALLLPIYSITFVLVRVLYFFLAYNVLKNKPAGFAIIAVTAIGVAESYFRPTSESNLALLNSILLYAWLCYSSSRQNWGKWKIPVTLTVMVLFVLFGYVSHSISLFSLLFIIIYFSIEYGKFKTATPNFAIIFTLFVFMFHVFLGNRDPNHENIYRHLLTSPVSIIKELHTYYPYKFFFRHFVSIFLPYGLLFLLTFILLVGKRKWLPAAFTILYSLLYFVIACASFKEGDSNMQMEKIFLPLTLFSALPLFESIKEYRKKNIRVILSSISVIIVIFGSSKINKFIPVYAKRIDTIQEEFIPRADKQKSRKLVIELEDVIKYPMVGCWAFGIETLILSTLNENIEPLTIFIDQGYSDIEEKMKMTDNFMPALFHTSFNYKSFNNHYFCLPEQEYIRWDIEESNE